MTKTVKVELMPIRDGETVSGSVVVEQLQNDYWVRTKSFDMSSDDPKSKTRTILVEDSERIIVEAASDVEAVVDPVQNVARMLPKDPVKRAAVLQLEAEAAAKALAVEEEAKKKAVEEQQKKVEEMKRFDARAAELRKETLQKPVELPKTNQVTGTSQPTKLEQMFSGNDAEPARVTPGQPAQAAQAAVPGQAAQPAVPARPATSGFKDDGQGARDSNQVRDKK